MGNQARFVREQEDQPSEPVRRSGISRKRARSLTFGQTALGAHQRAYEVVGAPIPPAFRSE
jgi:hypothetical protein